MKALKALGWRRVMRYLVHAPLLLHFKFLCYSPLRVLYLKIFGAKLGSGTVIGDIHLFNTYREGFKMLKMDEDGFIGDQCLLDLAGEISCGKQVTIAEGVTILTHTNVGYPDHPLQEQFPAFVKGVRLEDGCFIGIKAVIMPGVTIGQEAFVAAGSLVRADVPPRTLVAGIPARKIRAL